jgi:hypothetical protein
MGSPRPRTDPERLANRLMQYDGRRAGLAPYCLVFDLRPELPMGTWCFPWHVSHREHQFLCIPW